MPQRPINPESLIKGRIAESFVELLLQDNGYKVIRIAREGLLNGLAREDVRLLERSQSAGQALTAPSFIVIDQKGESATLVKVKHKSAEGRGANIAHGIGQIQKYWPETKLIIVSEEQPHFSVVDKSQKRTSIVQTFSQIKKESLDRFGEIILRRLT